MGSRTKTGALEASSGFVLIPGTMPGGVTSVTEAFLPAVRKPVFGLDVAIHLFLGSVDPREPAGCDRVLSVFGVRSLSRACLPVATRCTCPAPYGEQQRRALKGYQETHGRERT